MTQFVFPVLAFAFFLVLSCWAWWQMTRHPQKWAQWVDRENDFWRARGILSPARADSLKRWEKGRALKWLAFFTAIAAAIGLVITLCVLIKVERIEHHRLRIPQTTFKKKN